MRASWRGAYSFLGLLILPLSLMACVHGAIQPRTADLAAPGESALDLNFNVYGFANGELTMNADPPWNEDETVEVQSGLRGQPIVLILAIFLPMYNSEFVFRRGIFDRFEIGAILGLQQFGIENRVALLDENSSEPFSAALSAGAFYRPFMDPKAVWFRAGLDVSRRFGRVAPLLNFYVSHGPETHLLSADEFDESCPDDEFVSCGLVLTRGETRLNGAIGVSLYPKEDSDIGITFAMSPYYTLWADDRSELSCSNCNETPDVTGLTEDWGMTFTVGFSRNSI